jgi:hypothetical protein
VSSRENLTNPPKNKPRHRNLIFYSEIFYGEFEALYLLNISNLLSVTCFRQRTVIIPNFVKLDVIFVAKFIKKVISSEFSQFCGSFLYGFFILSQGAPAAYGCKI